MKKPIEQFIADNLSWTVSLISARIRNKSIAEDYAQEVMIKAFRAYESFDGENERAWLTVIARNYIYDQRDRDCISLSGMLDDGIMIEDVGCPTPEDEYESRELLTELLNAVSRMPKRDGEIFNLRFLQGFGESETALRVGVPVGTVKSRTNNIRKRLKNGFHIQNHNRNRSIIMNCDDFRGKLMLYSRGIECGDDFTAHLHDCEQCAALADSFKRLSEAIRYEAEADISHVLIVVPCPDGEYDWSYSKGIISEQKRGEIAMRNDELKAMLAAGELEKFELPRESLVKDVYRVTSHSSYDQFGLPLKFAKGGDGRWDIVYDRLPIYTGGYDYGKNHMFCKPERDYVRPKDGEDGVFECRLQNDFGPAVYSTLCFAVPRGAKVKIWQGSGVYDCGTYSFAVSSRFVAEDEIIVLKFDYSI